MRLLNNRIKLNLFFLNFFKNPLIILFFIMNKTIMK
jgi:hypothetical protein